MKYCIDLDEQIKDGILDIINTNFSIILISNIKYYENSIEFFNYFDNTFMIFEGRDCYLGRYDTDYDVRKIKICDFTSNLTGDLYEIMDDSILIIKRETDCYPSDYIGLSTYLEVGEKSVFKFNITDEELFDKILKVFDYLDYLEKCNNEKIIEINEKKAQEK